MKKLFLVLVLLFLLTSTALAAEVGPVSADPVRVAVIDSGISRTVIAPDRIVDGRNYIRPQDDTGDKVGHGTAVAAIIVGMENGKITGICPTAELVSLVYSSLDNEGKRVAGNAAMTAQAVYDAVDVYGCDIINISSGTASNDATLRNAVKYAAEQGALVIACAGNGGGSDLCYPGAYESVLCVGACDENGLLADFSQDNDTVDLLARGTKLSIASLRGSRIRGEGTSFSTALATGVAAQLWTQDPDLTAEELRTVLLDVCLTVEGRKVLDPARALSAQPDATPDTSSPETPSEELKSPTAFADVPMDAYFCDAVNWAAEKGITGGAGDGLFAPDKVCTRAQIVTFLWRAAGCPTPGGTENPFADLSSDAYYYDAVLWAVEKGITQGLTADTFGPQQAVTRGQSMTFLWRLDGATAADGENPFTDVPAGAYFADAVQWAVEEEITNGMTASSFAPGSGCTRGQIVTFLYRYLA